MEFAEPLMAKKEIEPEPVMGPPVDGPAPKESEDEFLHKLAQDKGSEAPWHHPKPKTFRWIGATVAFLAIIVGGVWGVSGAFSRATVTVIAEHAYEPFSFTATLDTKTASPDFNNNKLPLQLLKKNLESTKEYSATGEATVSTKAKGKITVYNKFSPESQTLIATTRFASPDGKIFRLTGRITVPGNGSIETEVAADQAGSAYNINPTTFSIPAFQGTPRYGKIYGESKEPFRGGASGKTTIVSPDDIKKAEADISKLVPDELMKEVKSSIPDGFVLLDSAVLFATSSVTDAKSGDAVPNFSVTIKSSADALVFDGFQIKELAKRHFGREDVLEQFPAAEFSFAYTLRLADFVRGALELTIDGSMDVAKSLNVSALKRSLAGKREADVKKELLAIPGIKEARAVMWPVWVRQMPDSPDRIEIRIE